MAVVLRSTWEGWGSLGLALGFRTAPIKTPLLLDAFVYGTVTSLSSRAIEHMTPEGYPVIVVVSLKILAPYVLSRLLKKGMAINIPKSFIHLENGVYLLALLDEMSLHDSHRIGASLIYHLEGKYRSFFD